MNWKKALLLVPAGLVMLLLLAPLAVGIIMVVEYPPGHHDFKEGLLALIPSAIMLIVIPVVTRALLKLDWFNDGGMRELCCPSCGYNMRGLSEAKCPECGKAFTIDQLAAK